MPLGQVVLSLYHPQVADGNSHLSGAIYIPTRAHRDMLDEAYSLFSATNPLHADAFPSVSARLSPGTRLWLRHAQHSVTVNFPSPLHVLGLCRNIELMSVCLFSQASQCMHAS